MQLLERFDLTLYRWLTPANMPTLDAVMSWVSAGGGAGLVWLVLAAVAMATARHRAAAWRVLLTVLLSYLLVDLVFKPTFARVRPAIHATAAKRQLPPQPRTYSFPSGHAASTFGAAVAVSRMWPETRWLWWMLAVLIGYSRIYLGHHYPLDVVGGAAIGVAVAFWVLGGRHPATYAVTASRPLPRETNP